jgi:hypothetical protein
VDRIIDSNWGYRSGFMKPTIEAAEYNWLQASKYLEQNPNSSLAAFQERNAVVQLNLAYMNQEN